MPPSIYAEQPLFGQFFEPVNTLTNLFFFISAWCIYRHMRRREMRAGIDPSRAGRAWSDKVYFWLVVCVGLGSTAWHFHQTPVTGALDVLPILAVIVLAAYRIVRRLGVRRPGLTTALVLLCIPLSGWLLFAAGVSGGWYAVLPSLVILSGLIVAMGGENRGRMLLPLGIFLVSLTLRQIDHWAAAFIPFGTHFLWHFLNAVVLYHLFAAGSESFQGA